MLTEAMKWNHLPVDGGLYAQHPKLLDRFYYILAERSKQEELDRQKKEAETGRRGRAPGRVAGRRSR